MLTKYLALFGEDREGLANWDGICVSCRHDYVNGCHGDCACRSCNAQRQDDERHSVTFDGESWIIREEV